MKTFLLRLAFAAVLVPPAAAAEPSPLAITRLGTRSVHKPDGESRSTGLYMLTLGDPSREDAKAERRPHEMAPFTMDSAMYAPAGDGTWRMFQVRWPNFSGKEDDDSQRFLDFLKRRDVQATLGDLYSRENFGVPGDFIYKRMGLRQDELPAPFDRLSAESLTPIKAFFQYNADGTMNVLLNEPDDEEPQARAYFERLKAEIEKGR